MARLQNAGRVSATNVEFDRSGPFADDREGLLRVVFVSREGRKAAMSGPSRVGPTHQHLGSMDAPHRSSVRAGMVGSSCLAAGSRARRA